MLTRSGISPPKVNRFGQNLEHSEYVPSSFRKCRFPVTKLCFGCGRPFGFRIYSFTIGTPLNSSILRSGKQRCFKFWNVTKFWGTTWISVPIPNFGDSSTLPYRKLPPCLMATVNWIIIGLRGSGYFWIVGYNRVFGTQTVLAYLMHFNAIKCTSTLYLYLVTKCLLQHCWLYRNQTFAFRTYVKLKQHEGYWKWTWCLRELRVLHGWNRRTTSWVRVELRRSKGLASRHKHNRNRTPSVHRWCATPPWPAYLRTPAATVKQPSW